MTTRTSTIEKTLHWRQPEAWKRAYELRSEREVVGLLRFPAWHRFDATGRIGDDEWQFVRKGFLTQRVEVLGGSASTKVAEFTERFPGGSGGVALANGRILEASNNFLLTEWRLSDGREVPLVRCHHAGGFLHSSATVDIRREAALLDAEPWLLLLGWYLLILKHGDSV